MEIRRGLLMGMAGNIPFKKVHSITVSTAIDYTIDFYNLIKTYSGYVRGKVYVFRISGNTSTSEYRGVIAVGYCHPNNGLLDTYCAYVRHANTTTFTNTTYNFFTTVNSIIEIYEVQ